MRMWIIVATAALGLVLAACGSGPAPQPPPAASGPLGALVGVVDERLATADPVAAAKWSSHGAVEDPTREQVVLDTAAQGAPARGLDPAAVSAVFRDQIQASKVVQYGLLEDWTAEPAHAPATPPDLSGARGVLDGITPRLLDTLAASAGARRAADCAARTREAELRVADARALDPLHRRALDRALRSVCS